MLKLIVYSTILVALVSVQNSTSHISGVSGKLPSPKQLITQNPILVSAELPAPTPPTPIAAPVGVSVDGVWGKLAACESGGNPATNTGNGYYGLYQYDLGTWGGYGGYARPDLAPAEVQTAKAMQTQAARGWSPWPACARKLGLL